jgi:hypothetical protein
VIGIEPFSFYSRLLTYPVRLRRRRAALVLMTLLFVSQVANALGFVLEAASRRSRPQ